MQYYQQGYQPSAAYQSATGSPTTPSTINSTSMMSHGLPPLQHHGMDAAGSALTHSQKRKQVKNACTNCQKACKKCDDARPCPRCVKYGIVDTCVNSVRKERKKGIKRGPYKRRQKQDGDKTTPTRKPDMGDQQSPYGAIRPPTMPFAYPSNLNQYGHPYDPYSQYAAAAYQKDQIMPQSYMYQSLGYQVPVLVPPGQQLHQQTQQQQQQDSHAHAYQHHSQSPQQLHNSSMSQNYGQVVGSHSPQTSRPPLLHANDHMSSPHMYYSHTQAQATPPRSSPHLQEVKTHQPNTPVPSTTTPVPSTSTSTATASSSPEPGDDDEGRKFARLSQLCSAALHHTEIASTDSSHARS